MDLWKSWWLEPDRLYDFFFGSLLYFCVVLLAAAVRRLMDWRGIIRKKMAHSAPFYKLFFSSSVMPDPALGEETSILYDRD